MYSLPVCQEQGRYYIFSVWFLFQIWHRNLFDISTFNNSLVAETTWLIPLIMASPPLAACNSGIHTQYIINSHIVLTLSGANIFPKHTVK